MSQGRKNKKQNFYLMTLNFKEQRDFYTSKIVCTTDHAIIHVIALVQTRNKSNCTVRIRLLMKLQIKYSRLAIQLVALPHDC